jgi:hypothetical protein
MEISINQKEYLRIFKPKTKSIKESTASSKSKNTSVKKKLVEKSKRIKISKIQNNIKNISKDSVNTKDKQT